MKHKNKKTSILKIVKTGFFIMILSFTACNESDCKYDTDDCEEFCEMFEDFEDDTIGTNGNNWLGIDDDGISIVLRNGTNVLEAIDDSGASFVYNVSNYIPENFIDEGCEFRYDVEYDAISNSNGATTDNSLFIFTGTNPLLYGSGAVFVLNSSSLIVSGAAPTTIRVPLELATGTTLPSNSMGNWVLSGSTGATTAADVASFNTIIQNVNGMAFFLDEGSNPSEEWWYDNFCFWQCCPN
ncbi:MAG: hypothetical protein V3U80_10820 [Flavobacteriaceae bacterium]